MERRVEALMNEMEIETGLAELRKARGLSQTELARRLGVTQPAVAKIESGRAKNLELKTLAKFVAALGGRLKVEILPGRGARHLHAAQ
jgi:transcriptional regulator with XRE-family HTH domain